MTSAIANLHTWQAQRLGQRSRAAKLARLAQLEHWQAERYKYRDAIDAVIAREQISIDNLRGQLA